MRKTLGLAIGAAVLLCICVPLMNVAQAQSPIKVQPPAVRQVPELGRAVQGPIRELPGKPFEGDPKRIVFSQGGSSEALFLAGSNVSSLAEGRLLRNGQPVSGFEVSVAQRFVEMPDVAALNLFLPPAGAPNGDYALEVRVGGAWVKTDVTVAVALPAQVAPAIAARRSATAPLRDDRLSVATYGLIRTAPLSIADPAAAQRRQRIQDALAAVPEPPAATVSDWYPKNIGALGGTLVLSGRKLEGIESVRVGATELMLVERRAPAAAGLPELAVYSFPAEPVTGDLVYLQGLRQGRSVPLPIQKGYRTVDQFSREWPASVATLVGVSPMAVGPTDAALDYRLNQGRIDAMRRASFVYLIENVPGNILRRAEAVVNLQRFKAQGLSNLSVAPVYRTADASGNVGFQGNAVMVEFSGYVTDIEPSDQLQPRRLDVSLRTESYLSTRSAENDVRRLSAAAVIEYNPLRAFEIANSRDAAGLFSFRRVASWGVTSGTSRNLDGSGAITVGQITLSNDIAFRIASGPFGTESVWASRPFVMPHGWLVSGAVWAETRHFPAGGPPKARSVHGRYRISGHVVNDFWSGGGPKPYNDCRDFAQYMAPYLGDAAAYVNPGPRHAPWRSGVDTRRTQFNLEPRLGNVDSSTNPSQQHISYALADGQPISSPGLTNCRPHPNIVANDGAPMQQHVKGTLIALQADPTGANDHRVTVVLESVKILGPHGGDLQAAMRAARPDADAKDHSGNVAGFVPGPVPVLESDHYRLADTVSYRELAQPAPR